MKSKIFKKIILVVVSVSVLVSAFVIPSFAYSVSEQSPDNTGLGLFENVFTPSVNMEVDFYANGIKKSSGYFPLFTNSNYSSDNRIFVQLPDAEDYGQLVGYADTVDTDIYETGNRILYLLNQSIHSYIVPNYVASSVDFDYYITALHNSSIYFNNQSPYGMNYSTFLYLDDTYNIGDTITYNRAISYMDTEGVYQGQIERDISAVVTYGEDGAKGIYLYYYNSSILEPNWLVTQSDILFHSPVVIDDYSYGNESGFIRTTSRFLTTYSYGEYIHNYLVNSNLDNYAMGYSDGFSEGETVGYDSGYLEGSTVGYNNGYDTGYNEGYDIGFEEGGNGVVTNPYDFILSTVSSFLAWEFIPGISFSLIASVFVGAILMIILLKKLAGG